MHIVLHQVQLCVNHEDYKWLWIIDNALASIYWLFCGSELHDNRESSAAQAGADSCSRIFMKALRRAFHSTSFHFMAGECLHRCSFWFLRKTSWSVYIHWKTAASLVMSTEFVDRKCNTKSFRRASLLPAMCLLPGSCEEDDGFNFHQSRSWGQQQHSGRCESSSGKFKLWKFSAEMEIFLRQSLSNNHQISNEGRNECQ